MPATAAATANIGIHPEFIFAKYSPKCLLIACLATTTRNRLTPFINVLIHLSAADVFSKFKSTDRPTSAFSLLELFIRQRPRYQLPEFTFLYRQSRDLSEKSHEFRVLDETDWAVTGSLVCLKCKKFSTPTGFEVLLPACTLRSKVCWISSFTENARSMLLYWLHCQSGSFLN